MFVGVGLGARGCGPPLAAAVRRAGAPLRWRGGAPGERERDPEPDPHRAHGGRPDDRAWRWSRSSRRSAPAFAAPIAKRSRAPSTPTTWSPPRTASNRSRRRPATPCRERPASAWSPTCAATRRRSSATKRSSTASPPNFGRVFNLNWSQGSERGPGGPGRARGGRREELRRRPRPAGRQPLLDCAPRRGSCCALRVAGIQAPTEVQKIDPLVAKVLISDRAFDALLPAAVEHLHLRRHARRRDRGPGSVPRKGAHALSRRGRLHQGGLGRQAGRAASTSCSTCSTCCWRCR